MSDTPNSETLSPVARFPIGTQYLSRGRFPRLCTVTDILRTYDSKDELISIRYVATHVFDGQTVTDSDVVDTTIAMDIEALNAANAKVRGRS